MLVWHAGSITNTRLIFVEAKKNQWMYLLDPVPPVRVIDASSAVKSLQYRNSQSVFANHVLMIFMNAPSLVYIEQIIISEKKIWQIIFRSS